MTITQNMDDRNLFQILKRYWTFEQIQLFFLLVRLETHGHSAVNCIIEWKLVLKLLTGPKEKKKQRSKQWPIMKNYFTSKQAMKCIANYNIWNPLKTALKRKRRYIEWSWYKWYRVCHGFKLTKQDNYFRVTFKHFWNK